MRVVAADTANETPQPIAVDPQPLPLRGAGEHVPAARAPEYTPESSSKPSALRIEDEEVHSAPAETHSGSIESEAIGTAAVIDDALLARVASLEARIEEQDAAMRRVLTLMVDWVESDARRPDLAVLQGGARG